MKIEYPKSVIENARYRGQLLTECEKDVGFASVVRETVRRDILFFFNVFCWAYDPMARSRRGVNLTSQDRLIVTYDYQDEAILYINDCIEKGENIFIDKSRDMLATYMILYTYLWRWLTKKSEQFRVGSRKEEYVDKSGDLSTHFEKMRYNLDRIPKFIKPVGFDKKKHSTYMRLINPEMGSAIIGEATNKDFGRGGRTTSILFDEFQAWEMAEEAWKSATDATRCKIVTGTPQGSGNKFAELSRTDEVGNKLHLMWYKHPEKAYTSPDYMGKLKEGIAIRGKTVKLGNDQSYAPAGCYIDTNGKIRSQWYDEELARRNDRDVAENIDCNYLTSGDPVFDTEKCKVKQLKCSEPIAIGELAWKVSPKFNDDGECINRDQLSVNFVTNMNGHLKIWEKPISAMENGYCIAADVSEGLTQGDFDSASVLKRFGDREGDLLRVVATIHGKMRTFEYSEMLAMLGVYYHNAVIAVERNNTMGGAVLEGLFNIYRKLFFKEIFTKGYATRTDKLGWETTSMSKGRIIGNLSRMISQDEFLDPDENFWSECITFVKDDGKLEAQGKTKGEKIYDDRVMDRAILLWIHSEIPLPTRKIQKPQLLGWRKEFERPTEGQLIRFVA